MKWLTVKPPIHPRGLAGVDEKAGAADLYIHILAEDTTQLLSMVQAWDTRRSELPMKSTGLSLRSTPTINAGC